MWYYPNVLVQHVRIIAAVQILDLPYFECYFWAASYSKEAVRVENY